MIVSRRKRPLLGGEKCKATESGLCYDQREENEQGFTAGSCPGYVPISGYYETRHDIKAARVAFREEFAFVFGELH
jgi:hypothetical protein